MPAGTVVNLAQLGDEYGVSRTVAREAMRLLESLGMLKARRRVGLTVTSPDHWQVLSPQVIEWRLAGPDLEAQLRSLLDLRIAVEPTAARLAAANATPAQRSRIVELAQQIRDLGERDLGTSDEYLAVDVEYHQLILAASGNEMLAALADAIEAVLVGRTRLGFTPSTPQPAALDHHDATGRAIAEGDADAAEQFSRLLVTTIRSELEEPPV